MHPFFFTDTGQKGLRSEALQVVAPPLRVRQVDGDGYEELYVLNTDQYSGMTGTSDRLYDREADSSYVELFALAENQNSANFVAGRSARRVPRQKTLLRESVPLRSCDSDSLVPLPEGNPTPSAPPPLGPRAPQHLPRSVSRVRVDSWGARPRHFRPLSPPHLPVSKAAGGPAPAWTARGAGGTA